MLYFFADSNVDPYTQLYSGPQQQSCICLTRYGIIKSPYHYDLGGTEPPKTTDRVVSNNKQAKQVNKYRQTMALKKSNS